MIILPGERSRPDFFPNGSMERASSTLDISQGSICRLRHSMSDSLGVHAVPRPRLLPHTLRAGRSRDGPAYVLVNGLTQYAELWGAYRDALVARGFRVATFDLLGQGESDKPALFISQDDQVAALALLDRSARRRPGFPRRHQLRRLDRAALRDRAWRAAGRAGADEHLRGAFSATAADRHRACAPA